MDKSTPLSISLPPHLSLTLPHISPSHFSLFLSLSVSACVNGMMVVIGCRSSGQLGWLVSRLSLQGMKSQNCAHWPAQSKLWRKENWWVSNITRTIRIVWFNMWFNLMMGQFGVFHRRKAILKFAMDCYGLLTTVDGGYWTNWTCTRTLMMHVCSEAPGETQMNVCSHPTAHITFRPITEQTQ